MESGLLALWPLTWLLKGRITAETVMGYAATHAPWQKGYHVGLEGSLTDLRLAGHLLSPHEIIYHKASLDTPLRSPTLSRLPPFPAGHLHHITGHSNLCLVGTPA